MALNRYRLQHLVKQKHKSAIRAQKLLERPDRLIGLILLGNNFVNILASSLATVIALRLYGEAGIAIAAGILTLVILIFGEVAPKTLAAAHPERVAFFAVWILLPLLRVFYPLVWLINLLANFTLFLIGVRFKQPPGILLSTEELRTVVAEAGTLLPERYRNTAMFTRPNAPAKVAAPGHMPERVSPPGSVQNDPSSTCTMPVASPASSAIEASTAKVIRSRPSSNRSKPVTIRACRYSSRI